MYKKNTYILFIFIFIFINFINSSTKNEWALKTKEINVNKYIDCNNSFENIKKVIKTECALPDDCGLGKVSWSFQYSEHNNNAELIYTFFRNAKNGKTELFDVYIDMLFEKIVKTTRYGNSQLGFTADVDELNLLKTPGEYIELIESDSELISKIKQLQNPEINIVFTDSKVEVAIFSGSSNAGAEIRKYLN